MPEVGGGRDGGLGPPALPQPESRVNTGSIRIQGASKVADDRAMASVLTPPKQPAPAPGRPLSAERPAAPLLPASAPTSSVLRRAAAHQQRVLDLRR